MERKKNGLDTAISEGDWVKNIILADIYYNEDFDGEDTMNIIRIGYAMKKLKKLEVTPPFWFFLFINIVFQIDEHILVGSVFKTFKNYEEMMTLIIHFLIDQQKIIIENLKNHLVFGHPSKKRI